MISVQQGWQKPVRRLIEMGSTTNVHMLWRPTTASYLIWVKSTGYLVCQCIGSRPTVNVVSETALWRQQLVSFTSRVLFVNQQWCKSCLWDSCWPLKTVCRYTNSSCIPSSARTYSRLQFVDEKNQVWRISLFPSTWCEAGADGCSYSPFLR